MGDDVPGAVGSPGGQVVKPIEVEGTAAMNGGKASVADGYVRCGLRGEENAS